TNYDEPQRFTTTKSRQSVPQQQLISSSLKRRPATSPKETFYENESVPSPSDYDLTLSTSISTTRTSHVSSNSSQPQTALVSTKSTNEIEIKIRFVFLRVGEIDTLNERYNAEIFFEACWIDECLKNQTLYDPSTHWNPDLTVINGLGDNKHDVWYTMTTSDGNTFPQVTEHHKITGVFWEKMELYHFPADVQELSISITTTKTLNDIKFVRNESKPSGVNRAVFTDQQEWYLYEHVEMEITEQAEEFSEAAQTHPVIVVSCHAGRWVVNKSLPIISYLTALDIYAIGSIVALCVINIYHGVIGYLYYVQLYPTTSSTTTIVNNSTELILIDRYAFGICTGSFFFHQCIILIYTLSPSYRRRRQIEKRDKENHP
ncbi:unnamed protein product, partial [Didymodactylos carnosus]